MNNDPIRQIVLEALSEWGRLAIDHAEFEHLTDEGYLFGQDAEEHPGNFDYSIMKATLVDEATEKIHVAFERGV